MQTSISSLVHPDSLRHPNEEEILYGSVSIAALAILLVGLISPFILLSLLLVLAVSVVLVWLQQSSYLATCVAVTATQFPDIHRAVQEAATRLGVAVPPLFIKQSPEFNAYAIGFLRKPSIVINSALAASLTGDELLHVLGHELTHIKYRHTHWTVITGSVSGIQVPVVSQVLSFVLLFWSRAAEYTSDRGGLLASRNVDAALRAMGKLAVGRELFDSLNLEAMLHQDDEQTKAYTPKVAELFQSHPFLLNRMRQLIKFAESPTYKISTQGLPT